MGEWIKEIDENGMIWRVNGDERIFIGSPVEWVEDVDEYGTWKVNGDVRVLVEHSPEYEKIKNEQLETPTEPTVEEKLVALKQENLTLKEAQAETNTTLLEFMEAVLIGGV